MFYGFGEISMFGPLNLLFNCLKYSSTMKRGTKGHDILTWKDVDH